MAALCMCDTGQGFLEETVGLEENLGPVGIVISV